MKLIRVTLLLLIVQNVVAQVSVPGSIEGLVVIAGSNDPVLGVILEIRRGDLTAEPVLAAVQPDGRFLFRSVAPGSYLLSGTRNGYLPVEWGQRSPNARGVPIVIAAGQQVTGIRLAMTPTAAISGLVTDRAGQPMPGVAVQLMKPQFQDGRRMLTVMKSMLTNDLGEYRIFWVPPGSYYVNVLPPADTPNAGGINLVMNPTGQPAGRSLWSNQTNVAIRPVGSGLRDTEAYLPIFFPGTPDENAATPVELQAGAEVRAIDIRVTPVRAFRVRGLVLNGTNRQPVPGAPVQLISTTSGNPRLLQTNADAMGMFVIPRVPAGPYVLGSLIVNSGVGRVINVELRESDIDATLELQSLHTVTGRVTASNPSALQVRLRMDYPIQNSPQFTATPAADGSFTLRGVPSGDFRVFVAPILLPQIPAPPTVPATLQNAYVKSIRFGDADLLNGRFRLDPSPEKQIEIHVATDAGSLTGRVLNSGQAPVPAATVVVMPEGERRLFRMDLFKVTTTNESGGFVIENLPPGDYRVFAWENVVDLAWQDPGFLRPYEEMKRAVRISENARQTLEITSIP